MEVTGVITDIQEQTGISRAGKSWTKKTIVIEFNEGLRTKHLALELFGDDKISGNPVSKGEEVTAIFDIESTEYAGRWYTAAKAFRISPLQASTQEELPPPPVKTRNNSDNGGTKVESVESNDFSDLPF